MATKQEEIEKVLREIKIELSEQDEELFAEIWFGFSEDMRSGLLKSFSGEDLVEFIDIYRKKKDALSKNDENALENIIEKERALIEKIEKSEN